jgi:hypothetical protein
MAATPNDPCQASLFSQVFSGNAIVCSSTFKDYETKSAQDSIQSVADNAAKFYDSTVADISQTAADQQEAQVPTDVQDTSESIANSTVGQVFTTCSNGDSGISVPGLPCIPWSYLAYGGIALIVLYFLAIISSFVPRPR